MSQIKSFQGEYRWLSNFWPCEIIVNGHRFPDVETAYQASKATSKADYNKIRRMPTPGRAKRAARSIKVREDWGEKKLEIMELLLREKFSHVEFAEKLFNTGNAELIEENTWGDTYWGMVRKDDSLMGDNNLGRLLMKLRAEIRDSVLEKKGVYEEKTI